jgi:4-hydroxy-tetrahydrodipicolinate synthase
MTPKELRMFCMAITPFAEDRSVDEPALQAHVDRVAAAGNGVYLGSPGAGEGQVLTVEEHRRVYEAGVAAAAGRVPVYANPRESRSAELVYEIAREAVAAGVDAIQLYALSPGQVMVPSLRELEAYYRELLDELDHPIVLSTSAVVATPPTPDLIRRLCDDYEQVIAVNVITRDGDEYVAFRDAIPDHLPIYGSFMAHTHWLMLGASGAIIAENNIAPNVARQLLEAFAAGDVAAAGEASLFLHRLSLLIREWFPATARPVKMALEVLGLGNGVMRPPYLLPPREDYDRLLAGLERLRVREREGLPLPAQA